MRAKAFMEVGGSPTYTLTEDFALGMELKKYGWQCRYVQEYLAVGEAPDQIRNCFQQRSRWTKVCCSPWSAGGADCLVVMNLRLCDTSFCQERRRMLHTWEQALRRHLARHQKRQHRGVLWIAACDNHQLVPTRLTSG